MPIGQCFKLEIGRERNLVAKRSLSAPAVETIELRGSVAPVGVCAKVLFRESKVGFVRDFIRIPEFEFEPLIDASACCCIVAGLCDKLVFLKARVVVLQIFAVDVFEASGAEMNCLPVIRPSVPSLGPSTLVPLLSGTCHRIRLTHLHARSESVDFAGRWLLRSCWGQIGSMPGLCKRRHQQFVPLRGIVGCRSGVGCGSKKNPVLHQSDLATAVGTYAPQPNVGAKAEAIFATYIYTRNLLQDAMHIVVRLRFELFFIDMVGRASDA